MSWVLFLSGLFNGLPCAGFVEGFPKACYRHNAFGSSFVSFKKAPA
jgi:hypothetical protein